MYHNGTFFLYGEAYGNQTLAAPYPWKLWPRLKVYTSTFLRLFTLELPGFTIPPYARRHDIHAIVPSVTFVRTPAHTASHQARTLYRGLRAGIRCRTLAARCGFRT